MGREYAPGRMVFAAAGPLKHEAIVETVARHFGDLPASEPPDAEPGRYTGGERRLVRKLEQANVVLGLPGVSFKDPGYYALHMFAHVLGGGLTSRLWHEVRETRGLAYGIDAFHWPFSDCGLFGIAAGTAGKDLPELVEVSLACARDAARDVDAVEIQRAKAQLKVALLTALETPGGRIERIARQILAWGRVFPARRSRAGSTPSPSRTSRRRARCCSGPPDARGGGPDPQAPGARRGRGAPRGLIAVRSPPIIFGPGTSARRWRPPASQCASLGPLARSSAATPIAHRLRRTSSTR